MMRQSGFTLVEALVAGVVSLLIPAVLIALINISNGQISGSAERMRLAQIADVVSEDIHRTALAASSVYAPSEVGAQCPDPASTPPVSTDHLTGIVFCDEKKDIIKGYKVVKDDPADPNGTLQEYVPGKGWSPISFSGDPVKVTFDPDPYNESKSKGLFGIWSNPGPGVVGGFAWFNFRYDMMVSGSHVTLSMQTQSAICRNAASWVAKW